MGKRDAVATSGKKIKIIKSPIIKSTFKKKEKQKQKGKRKEEIKMQVISIGIPLPVWARAVEVDGFVIIQNWEGRVICLLPRTLLPLSEKLREELEKKIEEMTDLFYVLFGY